MMSRRVRIAIFASGALGVLTLLVVAAFAIPPSGAAVSNTADAVLQGVVRERHATDAVAAVTFDYRGFDTLGEEFILYGSVLGVSLLLRDEKGKRKSADEDAPPAPSKPSAAVRLIARLLVGLTVVFGAYVVAHGHLSPGGGFQGGVILSTAPLVVYMASQPGALGELAPVGLIEMAEGIAGAAFVAVGLLGLFAGGAFLRNGLPLGSVGHLLSAGTIPLLNVITGLAVASGFLVLLSRFLAQATVQAEGSKA